MILRQLLPPCILAITIGVILGDLSLLGKKFIIILSAVPIVIVLSFVGLMLGLFFAELVFKFHLPISNVKDVIGIVLFFGATTAPPIIIYNYLTKSTRKYSAEVKEEESKKQQDEVKE
ncbi:MAG: hypothetical protein ACYS18_03930 [Planctomycetota bacterium]